MLVDVSALDDAISFAVGDSLDIKRTTANVDIEHANAQIWVTYDI